VEREVEMDLSTSRVVEHNLVGEELNDFSVSLGGDRIESTEFMKQVRLVVLVPWWLPDLRDQIVEVEKVFESDVPVLMVMLQASDNMVESWRRRLELKMPLAGDESGESIKALGSMSLPMSLILDERGQIEEVEYGHFSYQSLMERINRINDR
jgi:hypothetical protein